MKGVENKVILVERRLVASYRNKIRNDLKVADRLKIELNIGMLNVNWVNKKMEC